MSEAEKFVALGEAINEAFNNLRDASTAWTDAYEYGYKTGWDNASEKAKNLRDPARLAEIQHLQEALRKKNEKYQRLRGQYKRLKDTKRPRVRCLIAKETLSNGTWYVTVLDACHSYRYVGFPSWQAAVAYANGEIKEAAGGTQ